MKRPTKLPKRKITASFLPDSLHPKFCLLRRKQPLNDLSKVQLTFAFAEIFACFIYNSGPPHSEGILPLKYHPSFSTITSL